MSETAILVSDLHKRYHLGEISSGTFYGDLNKYWAKLRGKEDPTTKIGMENSSQEYWALKGIDFEIKKGESVGIIGKNGAGKSTLLKILSRVTTPTKGTVNINGRIASLLEVGTGFHPDLSGKENIYMNGSILGMNRHEIKTKLEEIIEFSGVEKYIDTPVKRYSSGMYVRLAFAVAAHLEPEILIVDEVLAVGDAEFQKKCIGKMKEVNSHGRTVIFVSHDMAAIRKFCLKVIVLQKGLIGFDGEINEGIGKYLAYKTVQSNNGLTINVIAQSASGNWEPGTFAKISVEWPENYFGLGWECDIAAYTLDGIKVFALQSNFFDEFDTSMVPAKGISFFIKNESFSENELRLDLGIRKRESAQYIILVEDFARLFPASYLLPNYRRSDVITIPGAYCEIIK